MNRRSFLKQASTLGGAAVFAPSLLRALDFSDFNPSQTTQVAFVKATDRATGVARAIDLLGFVESLAARTSSSSRISIARMPLLAQPAKKRWRRL